MPSVLPRTCVVTLLAALRATGRRQQLSRRMHYAAHNPSAGLCSMGSAAVSSTLALAAGTLPPFPPATAPQKMAWRPLALKALVQEPACRCRRPGKPQLPGGCRSPRDRRRFMSPHPPSPCLPPALPRGNPRLQPVPAALCGHEASLALARPPLSRPTQPAAERCCRRGQRRVSAGQAPQPAAASQAPWLRAASRGRRGHQRPDPCTPRRCGRVCPAPWSRWRSAASRRRRWACSLRRARLALVVLLLTRQVRRPEGALTPRAAATAA
jgi:hypothetical protein